MELMERYGAAITKYSQVKDMIKVCHLETAFQDR
jgi:hypothetical protein